MSLTDARLLDMAWMRVGDARALLDAGRTDAAYYLAGYAVEFGLKAVIAASMEASVFPGKQRFSEVWTHNPEKLAQIARLAGPLEARRRAEPAFRWNWRVVSAWSETVRYQPGGSFNAIRAASLLDAVSDETSGVLPWLTTFCAPRPSTAAHG